MADIRRRVERVIETDPVIKRGLQRQIINLRALARFILEADDVEATPDAVLGIIRRYPLGGEEEDGLRRVFRDCELAMRNRVGDLALENGPDIMKRIAEFASTVKTTKGESLRVIVGLKSIRVIADQKALENFRETLRPKEIVRYSTDLAEISLLLPHEAEEAKGTIARITTELALNDVNLIGVMCCSPESILLLAEKDAPRALEALQRMLREVKGKPKRGIAGSTKIARRRIPDQRSQTVRA
jgi:hypothetical protein